MHKDIFVMLDTSRVLALQKNPDFIPSSEYAQCGITPLTPYEFGCFKSGNTNIRIILCNGSSMSVVEFCKLWLLVYPKQIEKKDA